MNVDDWLHTPLPRLPYEQLSVWLDSGEVRTVVLRPERDPDTLWFTDCRHPEQNAICSRDRIKAWRPA